MSAIDINKLENVKERPGKLTARCPACAAAGQDSTGDHLVVFDSGKFACAANPGDHQHRTDIWKLVGDGSPPPRTWTLEKVAAEPPRTLRTLQSLHRCVQNDTPPRPKASPSPTPGVPSTAPVPAPAMSCAAHGQDRTDTGEPLTRTLDQSSPSPSPRLDQDHFVCTGAAKEASDPSETALSTAISQFGGQVVAVLAPQDRIPPEWLDVVADMAAGDPHWQHHPQVAGAATRGQLLAWTAAGRPIYGQRGGASHCPTPPARDTAAERRQALAAAATFLALRDQRGRAAATAGEITTALTVLRQWTDPVVIDVVNNLQLALPDAHRCTARLQRAGGYAAYQKLQPVTSN